MGKNKYKKTKRNRRSRRASVFPPTITNEAKTLQTKLKNLQEIIIEYHKPVFSLITMVVVISGIYLKYFYVNIEADLIVTNVKLMQTVNKHKKYSVTFKINNTGNQSVALIKAAAFAIAQNEKIENKLLNKGKSLIKFTDTEVNAKKIKTYEFSAWVDSDLIKEGFFLEKTSGAKSVVMPIRVQVYVYGADKKYYVATSPVIQLVYSKGRQLFLKEDLNTVNFVQIEGSLPTSFTF